MVDLMEEMCQAAALAALWRDRCEGLQPMCQAALAELIAAMSAVAPAGAVYSAGRWTCADGSSLVLAGRYDAMWRVINANREAPDDGQ